MADIIDLTIGGVDIPNADSAHTLSISKGDDGGWTMRVRGDGSLSMLTGPRFGKRRFTISARGPIPPDLSAINWKQPVVISYKDLALDDASSSITVRTPGPADDQNIRDARAGWTLTCREV